MRVWSSRRRTGSINRKWSHDMYEKRGDIENGNSEFPSGRNTRGGYAARRNFGLKGKSSASNGQKYEVWVTNLHWNVTADDVKELAAAVKGFRSVKMYYDESGRFTGTCTVRFDTLDSALIATAKYNGRALDSHTMQWTLVPPTSVLNEKSSVFDRLGKRPEDRLGPRADETQETRPSPGRKFRTNNKAFYTRKTQISGTAGTEDLDAEIEEYMNSGDAQQNSISAVDVNKNSHIQRSLMDYESESVPMPVLT